MVASAYVPLWVPAAVICILCLIPDFGGMVRRLVGWWHDRRILDAIWRDGDIGGGRSSSYGGELFVATTVRRTPAATDRGDAA